MSNPKNNMLAVGGNYIWKMDNKNDNCISERIAIPKQGKVYRSRYPKGTPSAAKSERVLCLIRDVWSTKPLTLNVKDSEGNIRQIVAHFDPQYKKGAKTDASKLAYGNRHGTNKDQRVTLDISDDWYEIAEEATYTHSKPETGKTTATHEGVKEWHYFIKDIMFQEHGETATAPYRVTINVKQKDDGNFVYSISAEEIK